VNYQLVLSHFQDRLQTNVSLSSHTTSRVGGIAEYFVEEFELSIFQSDIEWCWQNEIPFMVLGGGANILVSSDGIDKVVLHNRCSKIEIADSGSELIVHAESGAAFTAVSRFAAQHSLAGLEWACALPGSLGGATYGNAGAFGSDMSKTLKMAYILHRILGYKTFSADEMGYSYRSSILKRDPGNSIVLAADLKTRKGNENEINAIIDANITKRKASQPGGASTGSTFKNPVGDHAGRLIEAAGLKGTRIGGVQVSPLHANFLVNDGTAKAEDYYQLIQLIRKSVAEKFGVNLELEIELLGNWQVSK
jgi:UDP-N-acetylmuramate dehydrogenase